MKILIISDTHGRNVYVDQVLNNVSPIDLIIHLGDLEGGEEYIRSIASCPVEFVSGNNDFFNGLPKEKIIKLGEYSALLTHGHRYGVNVGTNVLKETAAMKRVNIVMFGHTHIPMIDLTNPIWFINPGSLGLPRQANRKPSFVIMELDPQGKAHFSLNYL